MARHRNVRNLDDDDINFYEEHYYSSVDDDYTISPNTANKYIFNNSKMSETLIMSPQTKSFEMDTNDFQPIDSKNESKMFFNEVFEIDEDYDDLSSNLISQANSSFSLRNTITTNVVDIKTNLKDKAEKSLPVKSVVDELDFDVLCSLTSSRVSVNNKMEAISSSSTDLTTNKRAISSATKKSINHSIIDPFKCAMFTRSTSQSLVESHQTNRVVKLSFTKPISNSKLSQSIGKSKVALNLNYNWLKRLKRSHDPMKRYYSLSRHKIPKFFLFDVPEPVVYHINPFTSSDMSRNYLRKLPMKKEKAKKSYFKPPGVKQPDTANKKIEGKTESSGESNNLTMNASFSSISGTIADKIDRKPLLKMYQESRENNFKPSLNLIVVGHVDAGKSTLMGNLLCQCGQVNSKQLAKFQWDAQKIGKGSFAFAWVLDQTKEERERGVTMDVSQSTLETEKKRIILLDAPGHKDFVPQVISGAAQADFAILVINASSGEFETGFEENGQTREHTILLRMFGINRLIVAVNKLDSINWSQDRFNDIKSRLSSFIKPLGMQSVDFVPVSGLMGVNLTDNSQSWCKNVKSQSTESDIKKLAPWYQGPSLMGIVDDWPEIERNIDEPLRFVVSDIYKPTGSSTPAVCGRMISGALSAGVNIPTSKVVCHPSGTPAIVKTIKSMCFSSNTQATDLFDESTMMNNTLKAAFNGDQIALFFQNIDPYHILTMGDIISDPDHPVSVTNRIKCKLTIMKLSHPLTKGFPVIVHHLCNSFNAKISKLLTSQERKGKNGQEPEINTRPRFITSNSTAEVELTLDKLRCIDLYDNCKPLGRFLIRLGTSSVAGGIVTGILKPKESSSNFN